MGTLYIIATPIGNREDISLRCVKTLNIVDVLLCEDTRRTGNFLDLIAKNNQFSIFNNQRKPKLVSYQEHNEVERIPEILVWLKEGKDVGLVSDAGTPLISDPGYKLVRECLKAGIKVVSIPGPSSVITALITSGLPTDKFMFLGYLPKKEGKRRKMLKDIKTIKHENIKTIIFFETAERLRESLSDIKEELGEIEIVIVRELTKVHEEVWRGKVSEALEHFKNPKGEIVLLINNEKQS